MTGFDRSDPFDRRVAEAVREIAATRMPDYLEDVFHQTARTRQRTRWATPGRWLGFPTDRPLVRALPVSMLVALALVAALLAVAAIVGSRRPDPLAGRMLAVVRTDGVWLVAPNGPERLLRAGSFVDAVWSPDGSRIALRTTDGQGAADGDGVVVILDVAGAVVGRTAADTPTIGPVAWSPDGTLILAHVWKASMDGGGDLVAFEVDGNLAWSTPLPTIGNRLWRVPRTVAWHPSGNWAIVDLRRERNLCHEAVIVATTQGGHPTELFEDDEAVRDCIAHRPVWSGLGTRLAMLKGGPDCWPWQDDPPCPTDLVVYDLPAGPRGPRAAPRVVATDISVGQHPVWLPGDRELVIARLSTVRGQSSVTLSVVDADGRGERSGGVISTADPRLQWADPGRSVLYRDGTLEGAGEPGPDPGDLRLFDLGSGTSRLLARDVIKAALQPGLP